MLHVVARTDIGRVRSKNEDAFVVDEETSLYAIADGMGGHQAGDVASAMALDTLREQIREHEGAAGETVLVDAVLAANRRVFEESVARGHIQGMGTTLTAFWLAAADRALIAHVGDSRCYRRRDGKLERLTKDHSWVQVQVDDGTLTDEEASRHPMRNVVTRSIGFEPEIEVDTHTVELQAGDVVLLATDGLTGKLTDKDLDEALAGATPDDLKQRVETLIASANERGGEDNITVILGYVGDSA